MDRISIPKTGDRLVATNHIKLLEKTVWQLEQPKDFFVEIYPGQVLTIVSSLRATEQDGHFVLKVSNPDRTFSFGERARTKQNIVVPIKFMSLNFMILGSEEEIPSHLKTLSEEYISRDNRWSDLV